MIASHHPQQSLWNTGDSGIDSSGAIEEEWEFSLVNIEDSDNLMDSSPITLPRQLHPAVSIGVKRVSTCFFSLDGSEANNSVADLLSLLGEDDDEKRVTSDAEPAEEGGLDLLYHDILMHVFTFLDATTLRDFSQTARRPNFECFYFLQLQLQRAMLPSSSSADTDIDEKPPDLLAGSGCLSRLAERDPAAAQHVLQGYLNSNSTLKTMPLSHSLAYLRHVLARHGFQQHMTTSRSPSQALASAAVLITMVGAASSFMELDASTLLQMGLAGSVLASTAKKMHEHTMRQTAEDMARMMQTLPSQMWQQLQQMRELPQVSLAARFYAAFRHHEEDGVVLNDYGEADEKSSKDMNPSPSNALYSRRAPDLQVPSGCVGAYSRAVHDASLQLRALIRRDRERNFMALSEEERRSVASQFLQACTSDDSLEIVRDMVRRRKIINVDGFYMGPDGVETCALHAAAFHGACRILEFLVSGLDEHSPEHDGGLANVNIVDANNWTAMHFCAGANSVEAVRILARHGALLAQEADNGYTPFHWAQRLSNHDVASELQRLGADQRFVMNGPLSAIASRFFAMMPS